MPEKRRRIITIAGRPGSGKSTTSKALAQELGYEHFSSGDLFRAIGKERGANIREANHLAHEQKDIDSIVDKRLQDIGKNQERVIIDSRLAWHWMPKSFKVYLELDLKIAALRIITNADRRRLENEHIPDDPIEYAEHLQDRLDQEAKRYKNLYDIDPYDHSNYDLVINTANHTVEEVAKQVLEAYEKWLDTHF